MTLLSVLPFIILDLQCLISQARVLASELAELLFRSINPVAILVLGTA